MPPAVHLEFRANRNFQVACTGFTHSAACFLLPPAKAMALFRGPSAPPPTALLSHIYAFKNAYSCMIRLSAAYAVTNGALYDLAMITFLSVVVLIGLERFKYKTIARTESVPPFITCGVGFVWMAMQRSWYLS